MKALLLCMPAVVCGLFLIIACEAEQEKSDEDGWTDLLGANPAHFWRQYQHDDFPDEGWHYEDGELIFYPPETDDWTSGLDIITREKYQDFELELEWKVTKGGNSGIFYHIAESERQMVWTGLEMQVLDNEHHFDATQGIDGNRKAGSLYDLIPANPQNTKPYGEWNKVRIISQGDHVEHWLNGEKVLEYTRFTEEWYELLSGSKFRDDPDFGEVREGYIGLQDHSDEVAFRNIRIRRL